MQHLRTWATLFDSRHASPYDAHARAALVAFARAQRHLTEIPIERLECSPQLPWHEEKGMLLSFFGMSGPSIAVHEWLWPLERQATEGLAYFLSEGSSATRLARVMAFLHALPAPQVGWPAELDAVRIYAEHQTGRRSNAGGGSSRVDLMIVGRHGKQTVGAVLEAKFEHHLKSNPLSHYVSAAAKHSLTPQNCSFVVLGIGTDRTVKTRLQRNALWSFYGWRRLLKLYNQLIPVEFDDDDFRRFRRTLLGRII